ncbi:PAS domain S-box protein [Iodobacter sp. CM08]|uniref:PAS domain S-box protein n=1 Tax=Iodobacter sp. CM08 TaxID=3085902 RepID=UPI0029810176|nr:PAS domain S-box protein [Iodobacter sp. CM08]MDW5418577.1 PAS domain S-box protein [Iodobacter sp. CM08]
MSIIGQGEGDRSGSADGVTEFHRQKTLLKTGALQDAIFNSAYFSSIATDDKGVIQIFNVGAERMLGYAARDVVNLITPADISDPQEVIARAEALSSELDTPITPGFEALVFKASRGIEDIYELTYIRKDGSRFPAVVSVTALRDDQDAIIGYLLIGTDNTARKQASQYARSLLEASLDPLVTISAEGKITDINEGSIKATGVAREKLIGTDFSDYFTEPAKAREGYQRVFAQGFVTDYPLTIRHRDGRLTDVLYNASVYKDVRGNVLGVFAAARDITERKRVEAALLKAGALQTAIFNSANFSSIATDAKGVIQIFNVGAERMLGYTAVEVMNKITPADFSDPQELVARAEALSIELGTPITPGFEALVFKAARGIEDIYELTKIRKDGSRFPAVVSVTALRDIDDAIIGYLLISTDNTARKLAEEALLKAGALQRAIFNSANFSSIATDAKGVIQIFNVGAERMLGYTAAEVMNKITPADISDPQELIARAAALSLELDTPITPGFEALVFKATRGIEDIYELTYFRKDGSRFPAVVSVTALRDAQDAIIGYLLIGTDNAARKQVEEARTVLDQRLRDQQFYTRSLIESNIDALMTTDPQGIISDVNQQMIALTGRTRDELIGAPCKNFFTDPIRADAAIKRVLTENKVSDYELTVRAQNGVETVVSYNAATFHDRDRKVQGVFAAARDVTERKRFELTLQEKNIELEHASRMKSEFLATMSHELRTPLNAIIGFSEALKDGFMGPTTEVQHEYIGDIFTSGQHLLLLINDILDLSKVEAGMMTLDLEPVDLHSLLSGSLSIVKEKAAIQRIHLGLEAGENLGFTQLDQRKTKQIVYNLLSNSVKFTASGGCVTLRARRVLRSSVGHILGNWPVHGFALGDNEYKEFLEICVTDNGIGISKANMAKLFQAFSQIDSRLARKFEGTGLGLAMVKQLAELHGGTVAVASAEGEGACFAAWLPLRELPAPLSAIGSYPILDSEKRIALVLESNERVAAMIALLLEAEGFRVLLAATTEQALSFALQQNIQLITLDWDLPSAGGGWEFLLRLRENASLARVPVMIISKLADSRMALVGGATAVLQKPVSHAELKSALATLHLSSSPWTVLVIDDDVKAIDALERLLPEPAYVVVRALNGHEGLRLARQLLPDLILLDLVMPEMSGFEVADALQLDPATADIPVLIVTSKRITELDRAVLSNRPERLVQIVEKAGFDRAGFIARVKRALQPH